MLLHSKESYPMCAAVVALCDSPESFLPSCIPYLQLNNT